MAREFSPRIRLVSAFRRLPVTSVILVVAGSLFASTLYTRQFEPVSPTRIEFPGATTVLQITVFPEVHGHFHLWRGEFWRILFNVLHHAGLMHLLMNSLSLWILADMLEARMGRVRFLLFFLTAGYVSVLSQTLLGDNASGMSGAVYAVFGYLVVLRKHDMETARRMSPSLVTLGFSCLILFVPLTAAGLIPVANLAHFVGLGYGWSLGWLACRIPRLARWKIRSGMVALHAVIIGLTVVAMHPVWDGRYHAWLAFGLDDQQLELDRWRKATSLRPDIAVAWLGQAEILDARRDRETAWRTALTGLRFNRTDEELDRFVRDMWNEIRFDPRQRQAALKELRQVFDSESDAWIRRLKLDEQRPVRTPIDIAEMLALLEEEPAQEPRLDAALDVPRDVAGITSRHPPELTPGEVNPDALDSAMLGETL